jgi:hypothetical protein
MAASRVAAGRVSSVDMFVSKRSRGMLSIVRRSFVFAVVAVALLSATALGANHGFNKTGTGSVYKWNDTNNWDSGTVPVGGDNVSIGVSGWGAYSPTDAYATVEDAGQVAGTVQMGRGGFAGTLKVTTGTLDVSALQLGAYGGSANLLIEGGAVNCSGTLHVGLEGGNSVGNVEWTGGDLTFEDGAGSVTGGVFFRDNGNASSGKTHSFTTAPGKTLTMAFLTMNAWSDWTGARFVIDHADTVVNVTGNAMIGGGTDEPNSVYDFDFSAGEFNVGGTLTLNVHRNFNWTGGKLAATTVRGNLDNPVAGVLSPGASIGQTSVVAYDSEDGDYSQGSGASMLIEVGGLGNNLGGVAGTDFDVVSVAGTAYLNGTIEVQLANGMTEGLVAGSTYDVLTAGSISDLGLSVLGADWEIIGGTTLRLSNVTGFQGATGDVVPEPAGVGLLGLAALAMRKRRS